MILCSFNAASKIFATVIDGALVASDCVVIITDHTAVDYQAVLRDAKQVVDTRNALRGVTSEKLVRL